MKWGLKDSLKVYTFRYNLPFNDMKPQDFFLDLANSSIFVKVLNRACIPSKGVSEVGLEKLYCNFTNLSFLNKLEDEGT